MPHLMKTVRLTLLRLAIFAVVSGVIHLRASTREQVISIQKGWNAVYLEVHPENPEPSVVFAGSPVEIAATFYAPATVAQFASNPGADMLRQTGWGVWYSEDRVDSFLSNLNSIYGQRAYLIFSKKDFVWKVTGTVLPIEVLWKPDSFNFVGFAVNARSGPTFGQFFSGSKAHKGGRIYRLVSGSWKLVADPMAENMRSGEAFWVYCEGSSTFQGPLRVETTTRRGLVLGSDAGSINLRNDADYPVKATLEHIVSGPDPVLLSILVKGLGDQVLPVRTVSAPLPDGAWTQALPPLEVGEALQVPFEARLSDPPKAFRSSILKISTDIGTEIYIPVVNTRPELEEK
jgi:hypothetical protein